MCVYVCVWTVRVHMCAFRYIYHVQYIGVRLDIHIIMCMPSGVCFFFCPTAVCDIQNDRTTCVPSIYTYMSIHVRRSHHKCVAATYIHIYMYSSDDCTTSVRLLMYPYWRRSHHMCGIPAMYIYIHIYVYITPTVWRVCVCVCVAGSFAADFSFVVYRPSSRDTEFSRIQ